MFSWPLSTCLPVETNTIATVHKFAKYKKKFQGQHGMLTRNIDFLLLDPLQVWPHLHIPIQLLVQTMIFCQHWLPSHPSNINTATNSCLLGCLQLPWTSLGVDEFEAKQTRSYVITPICLHVRQSVIIMTLTTQHWQNNNNNNNIGW